MVKVDTTVILNGTIISKVFNLGNANTEHLSFSSLSPNKYILWRGQINAFNMNDKKPDWKEYKKGINKTWQYVQVKIVTRKG